MKCKQICSDQARLGARHDCGEVAHSLFEGHYQRCWRLFDESQPSNRNKNFMHPTDSSGKTNQQ